MKKRLFLFLFLGLYYSQVTVFAQGNGNGWTPITDNSYNVTFSMPATPLVFDTLRVKMYSYQVDSLLGLQVHFFDSAYFNPSEPVINDALRRNSNDTLRTIAQIMLLIMNGELTSIQDITNGLEMSFSYQALPPGEAPYHTFIRYYLTNNRFLSFSVTGSEDDLNRLIDYKNNFFNNIQFAGQ